MTDLMSACGAALAGMIFGLTYFQALRRTAELLALGRGWAGPVALTLARVAGAVLLLTALARFGGALPLLSGFLGFVAARAIAVHLARGTG